jgi:hypothetical protein
MSNDPREYYLVETDAGTTYLLTQLPSVQVKMRIVGPQSEREVRRHKLDIDAAEYGRLTNQSVTHHIRYDKMSGKIMLELRKQPKPEAHQ